MKWASAHLFEITTIISGTTPKSSNPDYWGGTNVWVTPTDLGNLDKWIIESSARRITDIGVRSCNLSRIAAGAVVMSSRAPIGHLAIAGCDIYTNQGCKSFVCTDAIDPEFLFLTLRYRMAEIQTLGSGATFVEVSKSTLEAFEISFPEIGQQRRIANRLKAQLAEVEKARQAVDIQLRELKLALNQIIEEQIMDAIAKGEKPIRLGEIASITAKIVNPTITEYSDLPHISAENIESMTGRLVNVKTAKEDGMTSGKYLFDEGDVLYSKLRPYLRKVSKSPFKGLCSADMYPIKVERNRLDADFLKLFLTSNLFTGYANEKSARSRMPKLNREQLFEFEFCLPSIEHQKECVKKVNEAAEWVAQATESTKVMFSDINLLPQKILARAFGGSS